MSLLKCPECFVEWYGLVGDRCISCGSVAYVIKENSSLDAVREEARRVPINNNQALVDYFLDIFEEK